MPLRTFEHFPQDNKCPICGTNEDKECVLVGIDGTGDGRICEAVPVHLECVADYKRLRFNRDARIIYVHTLEEP